MTTRHRQLLDESVRFFAPQAGRLRGAKICITGASGFLAASLVTFLDELNRVVDLNLELHANARRPLAEVPLFKFLQVSPKVIWTQAAVEEVKLPEVENLIVIHTASYGSPRDYLREPMATYTANTQGLVRLMGQRRALRQFVYFSSAEIYGQPPDSQIPTPENYVGGLDTLSVRSIYGESKRMSEVLGVCLGEQQNTPFTVIRPWNVYGPGQRLDDGRVPVEFIRQARQEQAIKLSSNGTPRRAFCHVWDAMIQLAATLGHPAKMAAFNIGNPTEEISMLDLAHRCAVASKISPKKVIFDPHVRAGGLQRCAPDVSAVLALLTPPPPPLTPLDTGLTTLVEWHDFLGINKNF
jgi:dTDP-glucose 4,6-dehydratase/UDP-glucuronate decarboxylase